MRELPCLATPVDTSSSLPVTLWIQIRRTSQGSATATTHRSLAHSKQGILHSIRHRRKRRRDRLGNNSRSNLLTPEKGWKEERWWGHKKKEKKKEK